MLASLVLIFDQVHPAKSPAAQGASSQWVDVPAHALLSSLRHFVPAPEDYSRTIIVFGGVLLACIL